MGVPIARAREGGASAIGPRRRIRVNEYEKTPRAKKNLVANFGN